MYGVGGDNNDFSDMVGWGNNDFPVYGGWGNNYFPVYGGWGNNDSVYGRTMTPVYEGFYC